MRIHSKLVIAIVPLWMGLHANAAAAQSFEDRWSVIPKAHAEQPPPQPDKQAAPALQKQPPIESRAQQLQSPIPAAQAPGSTSRAAVRSFRRSFSGKASFYSYRAGKTASGSLFNRNLPTAAHRTLPFGTKVRVTNLTNNRSVVVTITDRGPKPLGRVLDLSLDAARVLGITDRDGVTRVRGEVL